MCSKNNMLVPEYYFDRPSKHAVQALAHNTGRDGQEAVTMRCSEGKMPLTRAYRNQKRCVESRFVILASPPNA